MRFLPPATAGVFGMDQQACPVCGHITNIAIDPLESMVAPQPDDITICMGCGAILKFLFDLSFAKLSTDEEVNLFLEASPQTLEIIKQGQTLARGRKK